MTLSEIWNLMKYFYGGIFLIWFSLNKMQFYEFTCAFPGLSYKI